MQPLVLAIEPDLRQAAIVKRIVREKVFADVAVVDSRDAALEAMRTTIPDVLLLSALLSPRDEDELVAHLRTRRDAEHLQTHTIPQLASAIGGGEAKPSKGLLSAFRRKKTEESAPSGCDPDLFAEEIRTYLQRASEKKREVRDAGPVDPVAIATPTPATRRDAAPAAAVEPAANNSSWDDPFAWRPSSSPSSPIANHESPIADPESPIADHGSPIADPVSPIADSVSPIADFEPLAAYSEAHEVFREPEPPYRDPLPADPDPQPAYAYSEPEPEPEPAPAPTPAPRVRYPLTMRHAHGWWFEEQKPGAHEPESEVDAVLESLAVPAMIAAIAYAEGCRIRRVRLMAD